MSVCKNQFLSSTFVKLMYILASMTVCKHVPVYIGSLYMCLLLPSADPPNQPQFEYCISYNDGQPTLQVISYVCKYSIM